MTNNENETTNERRLRRVAAKNGLTLIKYRQNSRWYWEYGPFAITDQHQRFHIYGLGLDEVENAINPDLETA